MGVFFMNNVIIKKQCNHSYFDLHDKITERFNINFPLFIFLFLYRINICRNL